MPSSPAITHSDGHGHADDVGVGRHQPDLGGRLEPRADRLPVDAPVDEVGLGRLAPDLEDPPAPFGVEPRDPLAAVLVGERQAEVQGDEVVGAEEGADAELGSKAADRGDREDPVAAELPRGRAGCERDRASPRWCTARARDAAGGPARRGRGRRPCPPPSRPRRARSPGSGSAPRIECPPTTASLPIGRS